MGSTRPHRGQTLMDPEFVPGVLRCPCRIVRHLPLEEQVPGTGPRVVRVDLEWPSPDPVAATVNGVLSSIRGRSTRFDASFQIHHDHPIH